MLLKVMKYIIPFCKEMDAVAAAKMLKLAGKVRKRHGFDLLFRKTYQ